MAHYTKITSKQRRAQETAFAKEPLHTKITRGRRRAEERALAKDARFWGDLRTADRMGYTKPIDRQAAKELSHKKKKK
jgi:hypothetical protein